MDGKVKGMGPSPENKTRSVCTAVKLEFFGEEVLEKYVKPSGSSGKIYLPSEWIGRKSESGQTGMKENDEAAISWYYSP